ncbi:Disulfide bond formation protein C [Patescibacteria group bacterium]|nr:Disulfide bond formation protein C [Patescibacteria group bacterium]
MFAKIKKTNPLLLVAWGMSLFATLASIYFIEIQGNPAAALCWFERMLIFGVFLILTVGIFREDANVKFYAAPFVGFGIPSALYQQLVHWNVIQVDSISCSLSTVCTTKFFELFGFVTQATLCLLAFVVVAVCLYRLKKA